MQKVQKFQVGLSRELGGLFMSRAMEGHLREAQRREAAKQGLLVAVARATLSPEELRGKRYRRSLKRRGQGESVYAKLPSRKGARREGFSLCGPLRFNQGLKSRSRNDELYRDAV